MSEEYQKCLLRWGADKAIKRPAKELCYALIDTRTMDIINVYSPHTSWQKAKEGARHFECGYAEIVCDVTFEALPLYKIYKPLSELTASSGTPFQKQKVTDFSKFKEVEVSSLATRTFKSINVTNFIGIKKDDTIIQVFARGTPMDLIASTALVFSADVVIVQAKAKYTITGLIRIEKTYEQLRQN